MSSSALTPPARKVIPGPGQPPMPAIPRDTLPRPVGTRHQRRRWIWATLAALAIVAAVGGQRGEALMP